MNGFTVVAQSLLLLLVTSSMSEAATTHRASTVSSVLAYPFHAGSSDASLVFRTARGKAYWLRLVAYPARDHGSVDFLVLTLNELGRSYENPYHGNLLASTPFVHGYQQWAFGAWDFAHGIPKSLGGKMRTIRLPGFGMEVQIEVDRAAVTATRASPQAAADYRFTHLTLRVVTSSR